MVRVHFEKSAGVLLALICTVAPAAAQSVQAVRLMATPRLDGRLDEEVWRTAPAMTGFTQREPNEGVPAIDRTEIRFAFDGAALWIGARMFASTPEEIRALVTRRDRETTADQISGSHRADRAPAGNSRQ